MTQLASISTKHLGRACMVSRQWFQYATVDSLWRTAAISAIPSARQLATIAGKSWRELYCQRRRAEMPPAEVYCCANFLIGIEVISDTLDDKTNPLFSTTSETPVFSSVLPFDSLGEITDNSCTILDHVPTGTDSVQPASILWAVTVDAGEMQYYCFPSNRVRLYIVRKSDQKIQMLTCQAGVKVDESLSEVDSINYGDVYCFDNEDLSIEVNVYDNCHMDTTTVEPSAPFEYKITRLVLKLWSLHSNITHGDFPKLLSRLSESRYV